MHSAKRWYARIQHPVTTEHQLPIESYFSLRFLVLKNEAEKRQIIDFVLIDVFVTIAIWYTFLLNEHRDIPFLDANKKNDTRPIWTEGV